MMDIHITSTDAQSRTVKASFAGSEIKGIASIKIMPIAPGGLIQAEIEMLSILDLHAKAKMLIVHPEAGDLRDVKRIEFADGSSWEMPE